MALNGSNSDGGSNLGFVGKITFSPSMMLPAFAYNNVSIAITARANHLALLTRIQTVAGIVG